MQYTDYSYLYYNMEFRSKSHRPLPNQTSKLKKRKSIAQRCRRQKTRTGAVYFSWKLHENLPYVTRVKRGQTFLSRNVWPRFSWVVNGKFSCNFHEKSTAPALVFWRRQRCAIALRWKCRDHVLAIFDWPRSVSGWNLWRPRYISNFTYVSGVEFLDS